MEMLLLICAGALVGFAIGLTGVGGGSLMTPILLLFNFPVAVAVGTDLLYAAVTKFGGMYFHHRQGNVNWRTMGLMAAGSIPVSILINTFVIDRSLARSDEFEGFVTGFLGVMLILTSIVMIFQRHIQRRIWSGDLVATGRLRTFYRKYVKSHSDAFTLFLGIVLGACVTLSSVGAGAFGAAVLFLLYPHWPAVNIVGTDISHAVPLTFVAGLGYLYNGLVDYELLIALLLGSLPGIYLGTMMGSKLPEKLLRWLLIVALLGLGLNFSLFQI